MNVPYAVAAPAVLGELRRLLEVVEHLDDRALLVSSRCFGWTRADLLAHIHLALQDMLVALVALVDPTQAEPDTDAASYWRAELPTNDSDGPFSSDPSDSFGSLRVIEWRTG